MEKSVLNRMYKSEIKVDLATLDQLQTAINKVTAFNGKVSSVSSNADKTNKLFVEALKQKDQILKDYTDNRKTANDLGQELNAQFKLISASAKELGLDVSTLPIYKVYLSAQEDLTKIRDINQSAWELVSKY